MAALAPLWTRYGQTDFLDCPGHGTGPSVRPDHRALFRDLDELSFGADLVGYSLGGRLAMWYGATHTSGLSHIIALSAHLGITEVGAREARRDRDQALAASLETTLDTDGALGKSLAERRTFLARWNSQPIFGDRTLTPSQLASRLGTPLRGFASSLRNDGTGVQPDLGDALATSKTPLIYLVGERDAPYQEQATRLGAIRPDATIVTVPGASHDLLADDPVAVCAILTGALSL